MKSFVSFAASCTKHWILFHAPARPHAARWRFITCNSEMRDERAPEITNHSPPCSLCVCLLPAAPMISLSALQKPLFTQRVAQTVNKTLRAPAKTLRKSHSSVRLGSYALPSDGVRVGVEGDSLQQLSAQTFRINSFWNIWRAFGRKKINLSFSRTRRDEDVCS